MHVLDKASEEIMESLAFIHIAINYEDPNPDPEIKAFENLNIPSSAVVGLAGVAVAVSVLGGAPDKATAATTLIGPGNSGQSVEAVQKALGIKVDGKYNTKTETAVTDFQIRQGLKRIDGIVGAETAKALGLDENYRPIGYVDTYSGIGLNIRSGPGTAYWIIGGAPDGAYLDQDYESVIYNDGYAWTPLYDGGWVASDYTTESYYPVSYYGDDYYDSGYEEYYPVSYRGGGGCYRWRCCYRPINYYPCWRPRPCNWVY
ncbi:peptidoglycan-binding protein [Kovacikia minuta CCNUW1]|uniref:peptidoglycan-binding protein n=1 Tax=Kovacikia minuta TaxID=2931930 RepID=UPI001CCEFC6B|nr:peptidoglycan-binding protein [Kovacikia minuta]UBF25430.1 peptidoglycan-binding protein [Kovacikia minuta CCNUW1]